MQSLERLVAEGQAFALTHITGLVEEMVDQRRKILHPFTERRQGEGNHGKAKVQVFAESALMNRLFQIFIRGGEKRTLARTSCVPPTRIMSDLAGLVRDGFAW